MLASNLGTPLFIPSQKDLGCQSNKVCVGWDITCPPPKQMVVNVEAGLKVLPLKFGTFFGACFKCNRFGHFAKDCEVTQEAKSEEKGSGRHCQSTHHTDISLACVGKLSEVESGPSKCIVEEGNSGVLLDKICNSPCSTQQEGVNEKSKCQFEKGSQKDEKSDSEMGTEENHPSSYCDS